MKTKLSDITNYFASLMKQYHELQMKAQQQDVYRIVHINEKGGKCILDVQIVGKNIVFKASPEELAGDDKMMNCFSRQDVRTITFFACQEIKKPKYSLLLKEFCGKLNKMIFSLGSRDKAEKIYRTAEEISSDEELLNSLSQKEAHLVGFMTATEKAAQDQEEKQKLHDLNIPKYDLINEEFSNSLNETIYTLKNRKTDQLRHISASELMHDAILLKGLDQKTIHQLGFSSAIKSTQKSEQQKQSLHDSKIPKFRLVAEEYSQTFNTTIYTLENINTNEIKYISADELVNDTTLLNGLSKKDAHRLGVALGIEINHL